MVSTIVYAESYADMHVLSAHAYLTTPPAPFARYLEPKPQPSTGRDALATETAYETEARLQATFSEKIHHTSCTTMVSSKCSGKEPVHRTQAGRN